MERPIRRSKKPRTKYSAEQVSLLERVFEGNRYPDTVTMETVALQLGVTTDRIAIWFQNRRSKLKRSCQDDHMTWMRKQIFHGGCDVTASPATQLPVFPPACHVLSPLEPLVTGREFPVDVTTSSPYTPVHPSRRPLHEPSPIPESPLLPLPRLTLFPGPDTTQPSSPLPNKENRDPVISNRDQLFRGSPYPTVYIPQLSAPATPVCGYGLFPFLPVMSPTPFYQTASHPHPSPRAPLRTTSSDQSTAPRTVPPPPMPLHHHDPRPVSARRLTPLSPGDNAGNTQQDDRLEEIRMPLFLATSTVDPVAKSLFPVQCERVDSSPEVREDNELTEQLLKETALECLAQWC